jgi:hypothetical protein
LPSYRIAPSEVENLAGGDRWAEYALTHGHARIQTIPADLLASDRKAARVEWLAAQVPPEERARVESESAKVTKIDGAAQALE